MTSPLIQNFSIAAGDAKTVNVDVGPDEGATLADCQIIWKVYEQEHGCPKPGVDPLITKTNETDGGITVISPTAPTFKIDLDKDDTVELLRNYYHEVTIIDDDGNRTTPTVGIMTVTQTENRDA
jgi:hypothetical protein